MFDLLQLSWTSEGKLVQGLIEWWYEDCWTDKLKDRQASPSHLI